MDVCKIREVCLGVGEIDVVGGDMTVVRGNSVDCVLVGLRRMDVHGLGDRAVVETVAKNVDGDLVHGFGLIFGQTDAV